MGEQPRIGFLGAGLIATYHSKSLRHSGAFVERAGVYDPDPRRAESFADASEHTATANEDEVLESRDAVYICTWTSEHLTIATQGICVSDEKRGTSERPPRSLGELAQRERRLNCRHTPAPLDVVTIYTPTSQLAVGLIDG